MTPRTRSLALLAALILALPSAHPAAPPRQRADRHSDPLPPGAVGRLRHSGAISAVVVTPDGKTVITADTGTIRVWDAATARELRRWAVTNAQALALSPDGKYLLSGHSDGVPRLWDTRSGRLLRTLASDSSGRGSPFGGGDGGERHSPTQAVAFSPDGRTCAGGAEDGTLELWDARTGRKLRTLSRDYSFGVNSVAFSPDGKTLASSSDFYAGRGRGFEPALRLWDVRSGRQVFGGLDFDIPSVAFSPDGRALAAGGRPALYDPETGKVLRECAGAICYVGPEAFAPGDGVRTSRIIVRTSGIRVDRRARSVGPVAFAPDGGTLAGGGRGGTAYVWDAATGEDVCSFAGHAKVRHRGGVLALTYFPDGRTLATAGADGAVLLWDLTGGLCPTRGRARTPPRAPREAWDDLASASAPRAHRAAWELVAAGGKGVSLLRERLRPTPAEERERLRGLLAGLDDDDFAVRERATRELARLGVEARPALREALRGKPSLEAHHRMKRLLAGAATGRWPPEALRKVRAVRVLGQIGTPEAVALLRSLARGAPASLVSREAKAALRRLEARTGAKPRAAGVTSGGVREDTFR